MTRTQEYIIVGAFVALIFLPSRSQAEEPGDFQDTAPTNPPQIMEENVATFCTIRFSETAATDHFSIAEFHSKDGTLVPKNIRGNVQILMEQLEVIRSYFGRPVIINSGYRSVQHNRNVGGASKSYHLCGMAADIIIPGIANHEVQQGILQLIASGQIINGGLGRYNSFTHYDIGPSRRWDKR